MSYTAPAGNAADVSWQGAAAYTPPAGDAANVIWATGLNSTQFGTPTVARAQPVVGVLSTSFGLAHVRPIQVGFSSTAVGIPYGVIDQLCLTDGVYSTQFGSHHNVRVQPVSGSILPNYGTPYGVQHWDAATLGPITRYGAVFYAYTFSGGAQGFSSTNIGAPFATRTTPGATGINTDTYAVYSTAFGTPNVAYPLSGTATGFATTQQGAHDARRAGTATGINSTLLGTHRAMFMTAGVGIYSVAYGTPTARRLIPATAVAPKTRYGRPVLWRSNTYPVYGVNASGRVGQPTGFSRHNHPVTGFFTSYVGVPSCRERSRVTHIPPGSAFGTPLLKRALTC